MCTCSSQLVLGAVHEKGPRTARAAVANSVRQVGLVKAGLPKAQHVTCHHRIVRCMYVFISKKYVHTCYNYMCTCTYVTVCAVYETQYVT